jgi:hypothetical protein
VISIPGGLCGFARAISSRKDAKNAKAFPQRSLRLRVRSFLAQRRQERQGFPQRPLRLCARYFLAQRRQERQAFSSAAFAA